MTISENGTGVGGLVTVAWTPLQGSGLTSSERVTAEQDVASARHVADTLLAAIKSAINDGRSSFSLDDLETAGQLSTLPNGDASSDDWAAFIARARGSEQSASAAGTFNEWRRVASDMQRYAAQLASRRDPSGGADGAGGVTHANGQWYANGYALSLLDLFTAVRVNQVANFDDSIEGYAGEMRANQVLLNAARAWLSYLRAQQPDPAAGKEIPKDTLDQRAVEDFTAEWGIDPVTTFMPRAAEDQTTTSYDPDLGPQTVNQGSQVLNPQPLTIWQTWTEQVKSFIDDKNTGNNTLKAQIDQKYNRRSEVIEAMTSFAGKESKSGSLMASSLD